MFGNRETSNADNAFGDGDVESFDRLNGNLLVEYLTQRLDSKEPYKAGRLDDVPHYLITTQVLEIMSHMEGKIEVTSKTKCKILLYYGNKHRIISST